MFNVAACIQQILGSTYHASTSSCDVIFTHAYSCNGFITSESNAVNDVWVERTQCGTLRTGRLEARVSVLTVNRLQ